MILLNVFFLFLVGITLTLVFSCSNIRITLLELVEEKQVYKLAVFERNKTDVRLCSLEFFHVINSKRFPYIQIDQIVWRTIIYLGFFPLHKYTERARTRNTRVLHVCVSRHALEVHAWVSNEFSVSP